MSLTQRHFILIPLIVLMFLINGCVLVDSLTGHSIPQRHFFEGDISQLNYNDLKRSFTERYQQVSEELVKLKEWNNRNENNKYASQIREHEDYLKLMDTYLFLCPEHDAGSAGNLHKCPICHQYYRGSIQGSTLK